MSHPASLYYSIPDQLPNALKPFNPSLECGLRSIVPFRTFKQGKSTSANVELWQRVSPPSEEAYYKVSHMEGDR
ncbi:hypothetical protein CTA1_6194 [Colletotrichum tanaceti]|uniref:Uncharacterized protein n=1 Tax=Colletotrichum tanaceti TaxID=1306861 RepID=A0A4U6X7L5_9PEZI|nr:hypothetical protein CTA1_6194 [Colletotrichum tanaceti]